MKNKVECNNCNNFTPPVLENEWDFFSKVKENAKCKLGKKVMFRKPKSPLDEDYGWIRYCNEFKDKI